MNTRVSNRDLFAAFRHAKLEVGRALGNREEFALYERSLDDNLQRLGKTLRRNPRWFDSLEIGQFGVWPKSVSLRETGAVHVGADRPHLWESASVRMVLEPKVDFSVAECLWIARFGPALDGLLSEDCLGNRLRLDKTGRRLRPSSRFLFRFWPKAYERFQHGALVAARNTLRNGAGCTLASFDFASFYDNVDPRFMLSDRFVARLRQQPRFDERLYLASTKSLLQSFASFRVSLSRAIGTPLKEVGDRGIPIGSIASSLIANLALEPLDRYVSKRVSYYSRYVDDIILVSTASDLADLDVQSVARKLLPTRKSSADVVQMSEKRLHRHGSDLFLQLEKLRVFFLKGDVGEEYLGAVRADLRRVQSERRHFLDGEVTTIAKTGHLVGNDSAPLTTLRKADVLRLERFSASTEMRNVARLLPMLSMNERRDFLQRRLALIARASEDLADWVRFLKVYLRVLQLCVAGGARKISQVLVRSFDRHLESLVHSAAPLTWGRQRAATNAVRSALTRTVRVMVREAVAGALGDAPVSTVLTKKVSAFAWSKRSWTILAKRLGRSDLRAFAAPEDRALNPRFFERLRTNPQPNLARYLPVDVLRTLLDFRKLARATRDKSYDHLGFQGIMLSCRPPTYTDLVLLGLSSGQPSSVFLIVNAIRGTNYQLETWKLGAHSHEIVVGSPYAPERKVHQSSRVSADPRLILANFYTARDAYAAAVKDLPNVCVTRAEGIATLLDKIVAESDTKIRPNLVLLPEVSLPRSWLPAVAKFLLQADIGLVSGLEYAHLPGNRIVNEAVAIIPTGYNTAAGCAWSKRNPAAREGKTLLDEGLTLVPRPAPFGGGAVLVGPHGRIGCLICSELLEPARAAPLVGQANMVLVPAWNTDTRTFDHLVRTTAMTVHAFVGVANNREYSDCRVRSPRKKSYARDEIRLIARERNRILSCVLDLDALNAFHGRSGSPGPEPSWKPLPPGFSID